MRNVTNTLPDLGINNINFILPLLSRGSMLKYKSSAVAEMGDRLATIDMGRKVGWGCCVGEG